MTMRVRSTFEDTLSHLQEQCTNVVHRRQYGGVVFLGMGLGYGYLFNVRQHI